MLMSAAVRLLWKRNLVASESTLLRNGGIQQAPEALEQISQKLKAGDECVLDVVGRLLRESVLHKPLRPGSQSAVRFRIHTWAKKVGF